MHGEQRTKPIVRFAEMQHRDPGVDPGVICGRPSVNNAIEHVFQKVSWMRTNKRHGLLLLKLTVIRLSTQNKLHAFRVVAHGMKARRKYFFYGGIIPKPEFQAEI